MRILTSTSDFLPNVGGVANVCMQLSEALARRGHDVTVLHWTDGDTESPARERIGSIQVVRAVLPSHGRLRRRLHWLHQVRATVRAVHADSAIDIIHCHSFHPDGFAARLFPKSCARVFTNHTSVFLRQIGQFRRRLELGWILRGFDLTLAPSRELAHESSVCGAQSVRYIPNGVDVDAFGSTLPREEACSRIGVSFEGKVMLVPRRVVEKNGIRYAAGAFTTVRQRFPEVQLLICGPDGGDGEWQVCESMLHDALVSGCARLCGPISHSEMRTYYSAADVVVLPSLVEATSLSCLEAMALGLPIVGTRVGGIPELIEHRKTGVLVAAKSAEEIAKGVCAVLDAPTAARKLGDAARIRAREEYSWNHISSLTEAAYEHCLTGLRRAGRR